MASKAKAAIPSSYANPDVLNIAGDLVPEVDKVLGELLERGKTQRVMILSGTESPTRATRPPYAVTQVEIKFEKEKDLRNCVRMLRWFDERLRARPDQLILWDWQSSFRDKMTIYFGVSWYDEEFFAKRKNAFTEPQHAGYYSMFGAKAEDFKMKHRVLKN